jgi:alkylation response protein AidB-like acyl-CoA dehydrogenase
VSTLLAGSTILDAGSEAQCRRWLPGLADGSRIGALALLDEAGLEPRGIRLGGRRDGAGVVLDGEKLAVAGGAQADLWVVAFRSGAGERDVSLAVLEAGVPGLSVEERASIDPTKRLATLRLGGVRAPADALLGEPGGAWPAVARALDRGAAAVTAEMIGAAEGALALTVRYAQQRRQFGHPIGHFQGVKHRLAERFVEIESLKSLLYYAAWALDRAPERVPLAVSEAKAFGSLAFAKVGIDTVQLHGAIGYTEEHDAHLYLRRSKWARPMYGDEDHHHDRIAALGGFGWTST